MITDSKGRQVIDLSVSGPDDDIMLDSASYDDGSKVSDDELDYIASKYDDALYDAWQDQEIVRAEFNRDLAEGR